MRRQISAESKWLASYPIGLCHTPLCWLAPEGLGH